MLNKLFTITVIISFSSFLLSNELIKVSNKEKNQTDTKQIEKRKHLPVEKKKQIEKKKQTKIEKRKQRPEKIKRQKKINKREEIRMLRKEYHIKKTEIRNSYRARIDRLKKSGNNSKLINDNAKEVRKLKFEGKTELESLEKEFAVRLKQIKNN